MLHVIFHSYYFSTKQLLLCNGTLKSMPFCGQLSVTTCQQGSYTKTRLCFYTHTYTCAGAHTNSIEQKFGLSDNRYVVFKYYTKSIAWQLIRGKISSLLNRLLHEFLGFAPTTVKQFSFIEYLFTTRWMISKQYSIFYGRVKIGSKMFWKCKFCWCETLTQLHNMYHMTRYTKLFSQINIK
jgi:hypothetical protein